jgi:Aromatic-ring-opening dioxygenase LigAB, LigA subunit
MSLYEVQKLLFHVNREPKMFARFQCERKTLIAEYQLTEKEQRALLETDFRCLYDMGVHSLLLGPLAATLGVSFPDYLAILRGNQR